MECIFCKIVANQLPSKVIFEDEAVIALEPLNIVSKGHIVLLTKTHFENILDVEDEAFKHFSSIMRKLSKRVVEDNNATGLNILNANGKDAQVSVSHLHFHLVPRYPNDGLDMWIKQNL